MLAHITVENFELELELGQDVGLRKQSVLIAHGDPARAVVWCCSADITAAGITRGMRVSDVRRRFPHVVILPKRPQFYEACSRQITEQLINGTPALEKTGLSSWTADLTGCDRLLRNNFLAWAERISRFLRESWGVTASIGLASNKVTAAFACHLARPGYAVLLLPRFEMDLIRNAPLDFLPQVSFQTCDFLKAKRLQWAWELMEIGRDRLCHWLGNHEGNQLWDIAHGRCLEPVLPLRLPSLLTHSFTFSQGTSSSHDVVQAGILLMGNILYDAGIRGGVVRRITSEIVYVDDHACQRQAHVTEVSSDSDYYVVVTRMLEGALTRRVQVRSLTLSCPVDLEPAQQSDFFSEKERVKRLDLEQAITDIRDKYGYRMLRPGSGMPRRGLPKKHAGRTRR